MGARNPNLRVSNDPPACRCCRRKLGINQPLAKASKRGAWKCGVCGTRYVRRLGFLRECLP